MTTGEGPPPSGSMIIPVAPITMVPESRTTARTAPQPPKKKGAGRTQSCPRITGGNVSIQFSKNPLPLPRTVAGAKRGGMIGRPQRAVNKNLPFFPLYVAKDRPGLPKDLLRPELIFWARVKAFTGFALQGPGSIEVAGHQKGLFPALLSQFPEQNSFLNDAASLLKIGT